MPEAAATQTHLTHIAIMMERLGLDPGAGAIARLGLCHAIAVRRCRACPIKADCGAWLADHRGPLAFAPAFCPSGDILFEMKFNDPGALR
ncbi:MAG: DUF6455 family protein [Pseudolabrys sp.]